MNNIITTNPINQTIAHANMKPTYGFISTAQILGQLESKGWQINSSTAANVRNPDKAGFQKHLIRLKNPDFAEIDINGDIVQPELVVLNSHDGSTSTRLFFGVLRIACLNGIIAGNAFNDVRVIHSKNFAKKLDTGLDFVANGIPDLISTIDQLSSKTFSAAGQAEFVKSVVDFKLRNVKNLVAIDYDSALKINRYSDQGNDAWTLMNRVQEALLRGGIRYTHKAEVFDKDALGNKVFCGLEQRNRKTSTVRSIPQTIKLNRLVFDKAIELAA